MSKFLLTSLSLISQLIFSACVSNCTSTEKSEPSPIPQALDEGSQARKTEDSQKAQEARRTLEAQKALEAQKIEQARKDESLASLFSHLKVIKPPPVVETRGQFGLTSETELGKIAPLLSGSPPGAFVTVGGDRAYRGAALLPSIESLVIFDNDAGTVRFNQINAKLLKAKDLATYRYLRWESKFNEWQSLDKSLSEEDFKFWRKIVLSEETLSEKLNRFESDIVSKRFMKLYAEKNRMSLRDSAWYLWTSQTNQCAIFFLEDPQKNKFLDAASFVRYRQGNYLFDEQLYQRLKSLALANKIFSVVADLSEQSTQDLIIAAFHDFDVTISVLDLDNTYVEDYIGPIKYERLVNGLLPSGKDNSLLIAMKNKVTDDRYPREQHCEFHIYNAYLGFTFEYLRRSPSSIEEKQLDQIWQESVPEFDQNSWQDIRLIK